MTPCSRDEVIETRAESLVQLQFLDATFLFVGPSSAVRLDSFVYNPDNTASKLVVKASKGAFRFISGKSNHSAYEIVTPRIARRLGHGARLRDNRRPVGRRAEARARWVCPHARLSANKANCIAVNEANMAVIVTKSGARGPRRNPPTCAISAISAAICARGFSRNDHAGGKREGAKEPKAAAPSAASPRSTLEAAPFCSQRCGDVDLGRWLKGVYAIPARPADEDQEDSEGEGADSSRPARG